ncbi:hypothetical protein BIW11_10789, partial [Tropilaelaps mercedesae]
MGDQRTVIAVYEVAALDLKGDSGQGPQSQGNSAKP